MQQDVAADPSCPAGGWRKRRADFDGGKRESEARNENNGADNPGGQVIVQDVEIRCAVGKNCTPHLRVGGIKNFRAEWPRLALQLKW